MKTLGSSFLALFAAAATAAAAGAPDHAAAKHQRPVGVPDQQIYLIESSPGATRWVTEDEKWQLKLASVNFIDITDEDEGEAVSSAEAPVVNYPTSLTKGEELKDHLLPKLSIHNLETTLATFSSFYTRYFRSPHGVESATWLLHQVNRTLAQSGASKHGATVESFKHDWDQFSIIARIPGQTNNTVVIGAHQDSINLFLPSLLPAPGADDDGSGTVTTLESLRVLLLDENIVKGAAQNTIEFHWYSAEEGGLLGSQAVFCQYRHDARVVKAMLQQDMTGYVQGTISAGKPEAVGVITDYVDKKLTDFIKNIVTEYCDIPYVETKCGYACSDHASASRYGYPSAFVIESAFEHSDKRIHTSADKLDYLSFAHMLQHAKMTTALTYELAFANL